MNQKRGAVVIGGHKQGLAIVRALGAHGVPSIVIDDGTCIAQYSRYCVGFYRTTSFQANDLVPLLLEIASQRDVQGWSLFPTNDHIVMAISRHRDELEQRYHISTPSPEIVEQFYNKRRTIELAQREGVPVPRTWFAPFDDLSSVVYPVLVKGVEGLSFYKQFGSKVFEAHDEEQLRAILDRIGQSGFPFELVMVQRLIPFDRQRVPSCVYFAIEGEVKARWVGEKIRSHPSFFGTATSAISIDRPDLLAEGEKMVRASGYTGVCEVEFLYDSADGQHKLIEINPRTWLWVGLAVKNGIDLPWYVHRYLETGKAETSYPQRHRIGVVWVSVMLEFLFGLRGVVKGDYPPSYALRMLGEWLAGLGTFLTGKVVFAVFDIRDLKPSIMDILKFRQIYGRR